MGTNNIGETLKMSRKESGKSVKEVSAFLKSKGVKAGENTIYSWENGNSMPTPDVLLMLCRLYGITDILTVFGYNSPKTEKAPVETDEGNAKAIKVNKIMRIVDKLDSSQLDSLEALLASIAELHKVKE